MTTTNGVLGMTWSACPVCAALVPARIEADDDGVWFRKYCPTHGGSRARVRDTAAEYLHTQRIVKPGWIPRAYSGDAAAPCPDGCGICSRHEQHLCMPIIEITNRCDLNCPICLNDSGTQPPRDLTVAELAGMLDRLLAAEGQIDLLNFSGGEPLLHPQLLELIDAALARPGIVRVSVSTNGLRILSMPGLAEELARRRVVVSLQFDGFSSAADLTLRGRELHPQKLAILELLRAAGATVSLTMTVAAGINDEQFGPVLDYYFAHSEIISMMIQPLAFTGRAADYSGRAARLTIPDVIARLAAAGNARVAAADFVPLPCSSPLCFSLAFYLMLDDGGSVPLAKLTDADTMLDNIANRVVFGLDPAEHERLRELIYNLWSGPVGAVPEGEQVLSTLRGIMRELGDSACCGGFDPRRAFVLAERKIKSIFIHAFQDAETFDLARVRRCCQAYPQADGKLIPVCVRNVRHNAIAAVDRG